jgi:predicted MFS family arabinose efflux permease
MLAGGALALAALPLSRVFRSSEVAATPAPQSGNARGELLAAFRNRDYWLITAGFFVCGFHVTFLTTHMPGVVELCGFSPTFAGVWLAIIGACNIAGSIGSGWLMQRVSMKWILGALYGLRALGIALFLLAPKTELVLLAFAVWMGLSYMATLPPTTGLIATLFGTRHIGVLLGVTMAVHQVGSFLGAWLGGVERQWHGGYTLTWVLDLTLALVAALVHVPIRERAAVEAARPATLSRQPSPSTRVLQPLAAR